MEEQNQQENTEKNQEHKKEIKEEKNKERFSLKNFHRKYYKHLLFIPAILFAISIIFIVGFYYQTGDFLYKDVSLTGGTTVTISDKLDPLKLQQDLQSELEEIHVREIYDLITNEQKAVILDTKSIPEKTREVLESYLGYELTEENSSFEFTGSALSESFFKQLMIAILVAFVFMAIVVFVLFKSFVPSTAVIISAFADILMTLALVDFLGIKLSSAGIVAFLMLIGYSVDTDIMLTNRLLKRHEDLIEQRLFNAFKTGTTMTLTSLVAVGVALIIVQSFSVVLTQIFTILVIGLSFDLINTWITNASILRWHLEKKEGKNET